MITSTQSHPASGKWPFSPARATFKRAVGLKIGLGDALQDKQFTQQGKLVCEQAKPASGGFSTSPFGARRMLGDVILVVAWGAMIPGILWLGNAVGF